MAGALCSKRSAYKLRVAKSNPVSPMPRVCRLPVTGARRLTLGFRCLSFVALPSIQYAFHVDIFKGLNRQEKV